MPIVRPGAFGRHVFLAPYARRPMMLPDTPGDVALYAWHLLLALLVPVTWPHGLAADDAAGENAPARTAQPQRQLATRRGDRKKACR